MSWPSNHDGWALTDDDGRRALLHTADGGTTWAPLGLDANGAVQVLFADITNGWLVGNGLQSTHDGGVTWSTVAVPDLAEGAALAASQGSVHVAYMGESSRAVGIATSPIDHDAFAASPFSIPAGAGPRLDVSLTAGGPYAALVYNDRTFVGAAQIVNGQWARWGVSCPFDNPKAAVGLSPTGRNLAVACGPSGFGDDAPIVAADLSSGRLNWVTVELAEGSTQGQANVALATATDAGVRVVGYTMADSTSEIAASSDGGATWPARTQLPAGTAPLSIAHFPDGSLLLALSPSGGLVSADGLSWTPVPAAPS